MSVYAYTARSNDGRFVAGSMLADSSDQVLAHLRTRALFVTSLETQTTLRGAVTSACTAMPVSASARLGLFRSLATLIKAGVPLRRALEVGIEQCRDRRLAEALRSVASDIEGGTSLSHAMARRPREFPRLFIALIRAGELGGVLDEVLERLATMLELDRSMRKRVAAALAYPILVTCAAVALVLFLVENIVPAFGGLFAEMHVDIPLSTKVIIAIGSGLRSPVAAGGFLVGVLGVAFIVRLAWSRPNLAPAFDRVILASPVAGPLIRKVMIARLSRTLGTLLRSGVALLNALEACRDVLGNALYSQSIETLEARLREGEPMTLTLEKSKLFDPIFLQLVRVGEETGTLDSMLLRVAEYFELDVETAISALSSIVEPLLIVFLGTAVGIIVGSVLIPLYSIIGSIK